MFPWTILQRIGSFLSYADRVSLQKTFNIKFSAAKRDNRMVCPNCARLLFHQILLDTQSYRWMNHLGSSDRRSDYKGIYRIDLWKFEELFLTLLRKLTQLEVFPNHRAVETHIRLQECHPGMNLPLLNTHFSVGRIMGLVEDLEEQNIHWDRPRKMSTVDDIVWCGTLREKRQFTIDNHILTPFLLVLKEELKLDLGSARSLGTTIMTRILDHHINVEPVVIRSVSY